MLRYTVEPSIPDTLGMAYVAGTTGGVLIKGDVLISGVSLWRDSIVIVACCFRLDMMDNNHDHSSYLSFRLLN